MYGDAAVIKLPSLPMAYNIEGLEISHGCLSQSFLLQMGVCVTVQSAFIQWCIMNRWLIMYQQLRCAVFLKSYFLILLAHYLAHWNY